MGHISIYGLICIGVLCVLTIPSVQVASDSAPSETECRPYIEKALNTAKADTTNNENGSAEIRANLTDANDNNNDDDSNENSGEKPDPNDAIVTDDNDHSEESKDDDNDGSTENTENDAENSNETANDGDDKSDEVTDGNDDNSKEDETDENKSNEDSIENDDNENENEKSTEQAETDKVDGNNDNDDDNAQSNEDSTEDDKDESKENADDVDSKEQRVEADDDDDDDDSKEAAAATTDGKDDDSVENNNSKEKENKDDDDDADADADADADSAENSGDSKEATEDNKSDENDKNDDNKDDDSVEEPVVKRVKKSVTKTKAESNEVSTKSYPVDDLLMETEIPENLRDRDHITEILRLDEESFARNEILQKTADSTLKDLKKIYENAIKPLETLYKYRDLSNRHFGDPEIFSKPLVLFMGPWSGGKSTILNYFTDNEYTEYSLRTGAEPSPAYFNILMHGDKPEVLDGTQLAADWTFSGLQKFGQGLQDRLRGLKLPNDLLKKVNIVEIPGILEVRKQVSRVFPFNDACQWFIDRADIIFLVYDPSKLDVGPETEAILDQLKGREYQTRIVLNKADQIHPEELLRVQSALIWNISPLMSSAQPPVMYTVSLWSHPFADNAPIRLLQAQEKTLLQDLSQAIEHRIENKIASARRFAVRVRNHAKMVDCYLTTYYNHKTLFGNKKKISGEIVEHPQNYHIYEGLSTLTNISRYDLPDPEVYRDFFRLNALYEFKKLSETCTYFRGCPINKLDVAIAYDLPELVNRYKRATEQALNTLELSSTVNDTSTDKR